MGVKMRRRSLITLIMSILLLLVLVQPVSAHSLEWGISVGDDFNFHVEGTINRTIDIDFDYSITVTELEYIPALITYLIHIPDVRYLLEYTNDGVFQTSPPLDDFVPIGDWDFMTNLTLQSWGPNTVVEVHEDSLHWEYHLTVPSTSAFPGDYECYLSYFKSDGSLSYFWYSLHSEGIVDDITYQRIVEEETTTPSITDNGQVMNIPLLAGIGVVVIIAASAGALFKLKNPHDVRVFVVCPYCGAKNEQGIFECQKCKADL